MEAVLPADFFAFEDAAGVVLDGDFVDWVAEAADFGGDLGAEFKAEAAEAHGAEDVNAEGFVGGGFVGDRAGVEDVGGGGEDFVGEPVGELHAFEVAHEAAAVDNSGLAVDDGLEDFEVVVGVVFEVSVLDEDDVAGGFADADADGSAFAEVFYGVVDGDETVIAIEDF